MKLEIEFENVKTNNVDHRIDIFIPIGQIFKIDGKRYVMVKDELDDSEQCNKCVFQKRYKCAFENKKLNLDCGYDRQDDCFSHAVEVKG